MRHQHLSPMTWPSISPARHPHQLPHPPPFYMLGRRKINIPSDPRWSEDTSSPALTSLTIYHSHHISSHLTNQVTFPSHHISPTKQLNQVPDEQVRGWRPHPPKFCLHRVGGERVGDTHIHDSFLGKSPRETGTLTPRERHTSVRCGDRRCWLACPRGWLLGGVT